jgi:hypothetical protein
MDVDSLKNIKEIFDLLIADIPEGRQRRKALYLIIAIGGIYLFGVFLAYKTKASWYANSIQVAAFLAALICSKLLSKKRAAEPIKWDLLAGANPVRFAQGTFVKKWGRQTEISELVNHISTGDRAVCLLWGPPGSGKTSVATALRSELESSTRTFITVDASQDDFEEILVTRLRENGSTQLTLDKILTSDRSRSEVIIFENASLARGSRLDRLIGITRLSIGLQATKRILLIILDDQEFRDIWQKEVWGSKAQSRLKRQQISNFAVNVALQAARDIKDDAAIPVTEEVLVRAVDDLALAGKGVSPLALGILMLLIAKSSAGSREFGLEDYRTSGGANGMMASFLVNEASSWAPRAWSQILLRIATVPEGGSTFTRAVFTDLVGVSPSEINAILDHFSSEDIRAFRLDLASGGYRIMEAWKPAITTMQNRFTRAVETAENSIRDKFIRWRDQWAAEELQGNMFRARRKSRKSLLSRKDLRFVNELEGRLSLWEGMADYVVRSRRYRLIQLITGLVLAISLPPMIYSGYEMLRDQAVALALKRAWGVPEDFEKHAQNISSISLVSGCTVNKLDWLPPKLRHLDAECENIEDLAGIPPHLIELDISSTRVRDLHLVPPGITHLNIASTNIGDDVNLRQYKTLRTLNIALSKITSLRLPALSALTLGNADLNDLEGLPGNLDSLDLSGSSVTSLRRLPEMLRRLRIKQNALGPIDYLPQHLDELDTDRILVRGVALPDSLRVLTTSVPLVVPQGLESLTLRGRPFPFAMPRGLKKLWMEWTTSELDLHDIPGTLESLKLVWPEDGNFADLPRSLKVLDLSGSKTVSSLEGLAAPVTDLNLSGTGFRDFRSVPVSVVRLTDQVCEMNEVKEVPTHLQMLDLSGCWKLDLLENLPESLQELNVTGTSISSLPKLPNSLLRLNISNTKIEGNLPPLPDKLQELTIHFHQLKSLEGLPANVNRIVFVGHEKDGKLLVTEPNGVGQPQ